MNKRNLNARRATLLRKNTFTPRRSGFTVVEVVVIIVILALLTIMGVASYTQIRNQSRDTQREGHITIMQNELEKFYQKHGQYPAGCPESTCTPAMLTQNTSSPHFNSTTTLATVRSVLPNIPVDFGDPIANNKTTPFKDRNQEPTRYYYFGGATNTTTGWLDASYDSAGYFPCSIRATIAPGETSSYVLGYFSEANNKWILKGGRFGDPLHIDWGTPAEGCVIITS